MPSPPEIPLLLYFKVGGYMVSPDGERTPDGTWKPVARVSRDDGQLSENRKHVYEGNFASQDDAATYAMDMALSDPHLLRPPDH